MTIKNKTRLHAETSDRPLSPFLALCDMPLATRLREPTLLLSPMVACLTKFILVAFHYIIYHPHDACTNFSTSNQHSHWARRVLAKSQIARFRNEVLAGSMLRSQHLAKLKPTFNGFLVSTTKDAAPCCDWLNCFFTLRHLDGHDALSTTYSLEQFIRLIPCQNFS